VGLHRRKNKKCYCLPTKYYFKINTLWEDKSLFLVFFLIFSVNHRIIVNETDLFPWVSLTLIFFMLLTSYLFTKYNVKGELNCTMKGLIWRRNKLQDDIFFNNESEIVLKYNSFAGEYSQLRIFLYGDKRSDGTNNFLEIRNDKERIKYRILINSEEEASLFISFFTKLRREQSLNVKIRNRMYWV